MKSKQSTSLEPCDLSPSSKPEPLLTTPQACTYITTISLSHSQQHLQPVSHPYLPALHPHQGPL
jgi:hypothetical protein